MLMPCKLIHNAGTARGASLKTMTQDDFDTVLDVHLRGAFHVVRPAFPIMCAAGYGRVELTTSIGGLYGSYNQAQPGDLALHLRTSVEAFVPSVVQRRTRDRGRGSKKRGEGACGHSILQDHYHLGKP